MEGFQGQRAGAVWGVRHAAAVAREQPLEHRRAGDGAPAGLHGQQQRALAAKLRYDADVCCGLPLHLPLALCPTR